MPDIIKGMTPLRRLAVYVDESEPGAFRWVLLERAGNPVFWTDIGEGEQVYGSWIEALLRGQRGADRPRR